MIITGVAGFIGSHLADYFIDEFDIIGIDNLSTGNIKNIDHLLNNKRFNFLKIDITRSFKIDEKIIIITGIVEIIKSPLITCVKFNE